jgi:hypothetical protein
MALQTQQASDVIINPTEAESVRATGPTWRAELMMTPRSKSIARASNTFNCGPGAWLMRPRLTCAPSCGERRSTARSSSGPPASKNHSTPAASGSVTEKLIHRVEAAGCPLVALTVDNTTGRNSQAYKRWRPKDLRPCAACHEGEPGTAIKERRMYDGIDMTGVTRLNPAMDRPSN